MSKLKISPEKERGRRAGLRDGDKQELREKEERGGQDWNNLAQKKKHSQYREKKKETDTGVKKGVHGRGLGRAAARMGLSIKFPESVRRPGSLKLLSHACIKGGTTRRMRVTDSRFLHNCKKKEKIGATIEGQTKMNTIKRGEYRIVVSLGATSSLRGEKGRGWKRGGEKTLVCGGCEKTEQ